MRIKILFSISLVALHIQYCTAQKIFDRGYLIKSNGDSLSGYLLYNGAPTKYFLLQYKKGANIKATTILPFDIVRFKVGEDFFVKEIVDVNEPSINPYFKSIGQFTHRMECFLRRVITGPKLDLYCYNGSKQRYFIRIKRQKDSLFANPVLNELLYWQPEDYISSSPFEHLDIITYRHMDSQMVQKKGPSMWYFGYRRQLSSFLKDSSEQAFRDLPYVESYLVSAIQFLNENISWTPPTKRRDVASKFFIAVGAGFSKSK